MIRKISLRGEYLLLETDKLLAIHRSEIKKMSTRKATCHYVCGKQYVYIDTPRQGICVYIKNKTYKELLLYILDIIYPEDAIEEQFSDEDILHKVPYD